MGILYRKRLAVSNINSIDTPAPLVREGGFRDSQKNLSTEQPGYLKQILTPSLASSYSIKPSRERHRLSITLISLVPVFSCSPRLISLPGPCWPPQAFAGGSSPAGFALYDHRETQLNFPH